MIKKTFKELQELDAIVGNMYAKDPTLKETKFGYAYKRLAEKYLIPTLNDFRQVLTDVRIDNALEDEKTKEILNDPMNQRGFKFSKEGLKKIIVLENKLAKEWEEKEIDVEPFISSFIPADLTHEQKEKFAGILIPVELTPETE